MRYIILFAFQALFIQTTIAQTEGMINYTETIKLDIQFEGMDESMKSMIPQSQSFDKELLFTRNESVYQNKKGEEAEDINLSSDDGSFQIKIITDDTEDILYKNLKEKKVVHQKGMMGKSFVVDRPLEKSKWKMTGEKIKYLDYECQKAVIEEDDNFIVAWFTPQIPVQIGPGSYHGLPGAILMISINDGETEIKATKVDIKTLDDKAIKIPDDGKKVTEEEYQRIQEEKEREIRERYGEGSVRKVKH